MEECRLLSGNIIGEMTKAQGKMRKLIRKRVPILEWLPKYNTDTAVADMIAGVTVGLTVMPQALAYAALAGLEPQYGLYSSFMGCFVYTIFGGCKDITIGPTALMSLMTNQQVVGRNPDYAILLCFLTGAILIVMAFMNLGVLVEFISQPVTVGFTTATSVIIIASQLKGLLGLSYESGNFLWTLRQFANNVHQTRWPDALLGFSCIAVLLFLRKVKDLYVIDKLKSTKNERFIAKSLWLLSTSRNALMVVFCSVLAYVLENNHGSVSFKITGNVRSGIPPFQLPPFSTVLENRTIDFGEMVSDLGSSIILVPVIAVLGNVAIAKAFAGGEPVDATQELLTLAGCNLFGSFVSSMPVTGSFSRSAVNHASGVKTTMGGVFTGILLLLALGVLTPYFYYIPKASLAAVIICAVIFMIEYEVIKPMWRASKRDILPMLVTFIVCLVSGVEIGILVGVGVNIALLLIYSARPKIVTNHLQCEGGIEYISIKPNSSVYFPGMEYLRSTVVTAGKSKLPIVFDCTLFENTDFTTAKGISSLINDFKKRHQPLFFYNVQPSLAAVLEPICSKNFMYYSDNEDLMQALNVAVKSGGDVDEVLHVTTEMRDVSLYHRGHTEPPENSQPLLVGQKKAAIVSSTLATS